MSNRRRILAEKLDELGSLEKDWNSYGAPPISAAAIETASKWLDHVFVGPMNDGGIQIEWHMAGLDFEIEIKADGSFGPWFVGSDL